MAVSVPNYSSSSLPIGDYYPNDNVGYYSSSTIDTFSYDKLQDLTDLIDIILSVMGSKMNFEKFQTLSDEEKKSFIRELKINSIVNDNSQNK